jgi:hypothetical protein
MPVWVGVRAVVAKMVHPRQSARGALCATRATVPSSVLACPAAPAFPEATTGQPLAPIETSGGKRPSDEVVARERAVICGAFMPAAGICL